CSIRATDPFILKISAGWAFEFLTSAIFKARVERLELFVFLLSQIIFLLSLDLILVVFCI
ncbi:hypothetical protein, partial [Photobacterium sanguinicancri]|uniref:hypothetical protein n=1 Tax=Photobacterium sanguinicancri TaxID=875932 RepID=UPI000AF12F92